MRNFNLIVCVFVLSVFFLFGIEPLDATPYWRPQPTESSLQTRHPSLNVVIAKLKRFPESNKVIEEALKGGSITVEMVQNEMPFGAMWDNGMRKIVINARSCKDQGNFLCDLLFELMNAVSERKYQALYRQAQEGRIDCDSYVETVEKIEHENMINTVNIIEKGILAGVFPQSARWRIIYDFSIHYKIQQLTGHSLYIVKEYQDIKSYQSFSPYRGTVKNLKQMSERERLDMADFLYTDYFRPGGKKIHHSQNIHS